MPVSPVLENAAYLTICDWGDRVPSRMDRLRLLAEAAGLDPEALNFRVAKAAPVVLARVDAATAPSVLSALRERGVSAVAPTGSELRRLSEADLIADMEPLDQGWRVSFRGSDVSAVLTPRTLFLVVHGELGRHRGAAGAEQTKAPAIDVPDPLGELESAYRDFAGWGANAGGMRGSLDAVRGDAGDALPSIARHPVGEHVTQVIDLWLRGGTRFRIDGDRFAWRVLGAERGYADAVNARAVIDLLSERAPGAIIDGGFARFSCADPAALKLFDRVKPGRRVDPAFEFYSRWAFLFFQGASRGEVPGAGRQDSGAEG